MKCNPRWDSCLGDRMDRGAWWAAVHGVPKESENNLSTKPQLLLCLLFGAFSSLTLKIIIDRYAFIAILSLAFQLIFYFFFVPFLFFLLFLCGLMVFFCIMLEFCSFQFCESIICFLFMVMLVFKHVNTLLAGSHISSNTFFKKI